MTIDAKLNERLLKIQRNRDRMRRNGVVHRVGADGLIRSRPRLIRPAFPWRGVAIVLGLVVLFKSILFAQIGPDDYAERVEVLGNGTTIERVGAVIMQDDPLTVALAGTLQHYIFQR